MSVTPQKPPRNAPCPCGSGRKFKHCCGKDTQTAPLQSSNTLLQEALRLQQTNRLAEAEALYRKAIRMDPGKPHAHYLLGLVRAGLGDISAGAGLVARAFELGLRDAAAFLQYAKLLLALGNTEQAMAQLQRALDIKPDFTEACEALGNICYETGRYEDAEVHYRRAIALDPNAWTPGYNLAHALYRRQRYDEAIGELDRVAELAPAKAEVYAIQALVFELNHQLGEAEDRARKALAMRPNNPTALLVLAKLARRGGRAPEALQLLDRVDRNGLNPYEVVTFWNERGRVLDALERYDQAFEAFRKSKTTLADLREIRFDAQPWDDRLDRVERHVAAAPADTIAHANTLPEIFPRPIFVLGFHRSGTTLVEQMLSSHANICAGGELELVPKLERRMEEALGRPFPECLTALSRSDGRILIVEMREIYVREVRNATIERSGETWITDKSPFNSTHLLAIKLLFPDAPILRILRNPLDVVLSCYFETFLDRNEWSFDLHDIAWLYARLHRHLPTMRPALGRNYMEVRYEALVADPETTLLRVLDLVGEPWDPACLKFHESRHRARTASYAQVTRPLYRSSINRYLNYFGHIDEATVSTLQPALADLGYAVGELHRV